MLDLKLATTFLRQRQSLPLTAKVRLSSIRIREWYRMWGGDVGLMVSGLDSWVMAHLVRTLYPDVPGFHAVASEPASVAKYAKAMGNIRLVGPIKPFRRVVAEDGWPVISKSVSRFIHDLRRPPGNEATKSLHLTGFNRAGTFCPTMFLAQKWRFLLHAPFLISNKCCYYLKEGPLRKVCKHPFIGTRAEESSQREREYKMRRCNYSHGTTSRSTPIAFWLRSDVEEYARAEGIANPGDMEGSGRTGCQMCLFGIMFDRCPNRIQRLELSNPAVHAAFGRLGGFEVMKFLGLPWSIAATPKPLFPPEPAETQAGLFETKEKA